jgi:hypothetical protein
MLYFYTFGKFIISKLNFFYLANKRNNLLFNSYCGKVMVSKAANLWLQSQQHFHQHAIAEGACWQRNINYCAADKFWLSLVSLLMPNSSDTHLQVANFQL